MAQIVNLQAKAAKEQAGRAETNGKAKASESSGEDSSAAKVCHAALLDWHQYLCPLGLWHHRMSGHPQALGFVIFCYAYSCPLARRGKCVQLEEVSLTLQGGSDDEAAIVNQWISTNSKDRFKAGREAQAASDSAAAAPRNASQHNLAASSHSSLTGAQILWQLYVLPSPSRCPLLIHPFSLGIYHAISSMKSAQKARLMYSA